MQLLCITAFLLSAVAANPDSWRPWQDESPPAHGPKFDVDSKRGDGKHSMTQVPEDREGLTGGDSMLGESGHPIWLHEMPPWVPQMPSERSGNGNPHQSIGTDKDDHQPGRPSQLPPRGKRQTPPGFNNRGHNIRAPPRGKWPNRRNPNPASKLVFAPTFTVDNVEFQNATDVTLKEGENLFLMPKHGGRGPRHHKGGKHGHAEIGQYVKLIYNMTKPTQVSLEYGVVKPMKLDQLRGEENNPVEDDW